MSLEQFGWNAYFANEFARLGDPEAEPGRVALTDRERFLVWSSSGEREAAIGGRLRYDSGDWPAIGDWVSLEGGARIAAVLPRQTTFARKQPGEVTSRQVIAANIDAVFVINGLDGDFNLRRIERYLLLAWESGAKPVVVLNKADVCPDPIRAAEDVQAAAPGVPVVTISAQEGWGLPELEAHLAPGRTAAFIGSSGAGKSTLVNRLLGDARQRVKEVRADDSRGRHTTVRRELFLAPNGWLLIDTPGLRELQLWASPSSVDLAFQDIAALASECRFRDCRHQDEPGCAVTQAGIDEARLANYHKMQRELAHLDRQQDRRAAQEEKHKIKRIHRAMRGRNRI